MECEMSPVKRRLSSLIIFSVTIFLTIGISSAMYFFKIQKNEDYQNRLHFRELNEISRSISISIGQIFEIAELGNNRVKLASNSDSENTLDKKKAADKMQERVGLANRSLNLRSLKVAEQPDYAKQKMAALNDLPNSPENVKSIAKKLYFHESGKSYLGFTGCKNQSGEIKETCDQVQANGLEIQTSDFIPANIQRFPLILIVKQDGNVIARKQLNRQGVETADLQIRDVGKFFDLVSQQNQQSHSDEIQEGSKQPPEMSEIVDTTIGGIAYRIFIQPVNLSFHATNSNQIFLIGMIPADELRLAKLSVSPNTALWFVLLLLGLVALLPVIKLRFVSPKYAFSRGDVSQIGLGLIVVVGISSIALNHHLFYGFLISEKVHQGKMLHKQINQELASEISTLSREMKLYSKKLEDKVDTESLATIFSDNSKAPICITIPFDRGEPEGEKKVFNSCVETGLVLSQSSSNNIIDDKLDRFDYLIEGTFVLNDKGRFAENYPTAWINESLLVGRDVNLNYRQYFQDAIDCNVWKYQDAGCDTGIVFERINNVRDGRKNTQFAIPLFSDITEENKKVLSFGTRLRTFFHRVMPRNFGYLIFNNEGTVLFHSDEQRSLIENIYIETDNNKQLHNVVANQKVVKDVLEFDLVYRGKSHIFLLGSLLKNSDVLDSKFGHLKTSDPNLTLAIFFDETEAALNNMLLVFLAIILFLLIITPIYMYFRYVTSQPFWASLLYFNPKHTRHYKAWIILISGAILFSLFMMGIVPDLAIRIAIWLVIGCVVLRLIISSVNTSDSGFALKTEPPDSLSNKSPPKTVLRGAIPSLKPVYFVLSLLVAVGTASGLINGNYELSNWVFFTIGAVAFIGGVIWQIYKPTNDSPNDSMKYKERYTKPYIGYLLAIIFFTGAVPASLIVNSANGYLLQHQAQLESRHLLAKNEQYQNELDDYLHLMAPDKVDKYVRKNWVNDASLTKLYPAYGNWVRNNHSMSGSGMDGLINSLFSNVSFADSLLTEMSQLARTKDNTSINSTSLNESLPLKYFPDVFMLNASASNPLFTILMLIIQLIIMHRLIELLLVRRLFGDHLSDDFRITFPTEIASQDAKWVNIGSELKASKSIHLLLLHSTASKVSKELCKLGVSIYENKIFTIEDLLVKQSDNVSFVDKLISIDKGNIKTLVIEGYEDLAFMPERRLSALEFTKTILGLPHLNIVIVSDTAPIYRLIKQDEYPHLEESAVALAAEELGWSKVFAKFSKVYDWTPANKFMPKEVDDILQLVENEANGWPELRKIELAFNEYHAQIKLTDPNAKISAPNLHQHWKPNQIIDFFAVHAGALYRMKWELCTKNERFLLYQLASGGNANPLNIEVLEHLMRRGYIYRDAGWHVVNDSFKRFILSAEREESIIEWQSDANSGIWSLLRIPIFTMVLVLLVVTVFSSGQAIDSAIGIMTAVLGMVPLLLRNVALLKGSSSTLGE